MYKIFTLQHLNVIHRLRLWAHIVRQSLSVILFCQHEIFWISRGDLEPIGVPPKNQYKSKPIGIHNICYNIPILPFLFLVTNLSNDSGRPLFASFHLATPHRFFDLGL